MESNLGVIFVVSTPIGNLADITLRALETLKSADYVISEDSRETRKIFQHYNFEKPQLVYTDQRHTRVIGDILDILRAGQNIALVSDSGTPVISDPGYKLIVELIKEGVQIISIPGPNAAISAISVSGLPTDKFVFLGFLPKSSKKRKDMLKEFGSLETTLIVYESPFRINKLLEEIQSTLGNRYVSVIKDLTKMHEMKITDKVEAVITNHKIIEKGEYTVLVAKEGFIL